MTRRRRVDRFYARLLRLLPFDFQREYGDEMATVFRDERRAADVGGIVMARVQVQVLGQRHDADRPDAGGEEAVDVGDRQAGVFERTARARPGQSRSPRMIVMPK